MTLALPKIVYDNGRSSFVFTYPPRLRPFRIYESVRHDQISSGGTRESIWERTDEFFEFDMEYVRIGADVQAWDSFVQSAIRAPWPSMSFRISTPMTRLIAISSVLTRAKAIVGMGHFPPSRPG